MTTIGNVGHARGAPRSRRGAPSSRGTGRPTLDWWVAADDRWHTPRDEPSVRQRRVLGRAGGGDRAPGAQRRRPAARLLHGRRRRPHRRRDRERVAAAVRGGLQPRRAADGRGPRPTSRSRASSCRRPRWCSRSVTAASCASPSPTTGAAPAPWPGRCRPPTRWRGAGSPRPRPACASRASTSWPTTSWRPGRPCCWRGRRRRDDPVGVPPRPHRAGAAGPARRAVGGGGRPGRRKAWPARRGGAARRRGTRRLRSTGRPRSSTPRASPEPSPTSPRSVARLGPAEPPPDEPPDGARSWRGWSGGSRCRRLGARTSSRRLPPAWRGRNLALYGLPGPRGAVSFALRWHGDRPALLWDVTGDLELRAPGLDAAWSTSAASGEALLAAPPP